VTLSVDLPTMRTLVRTEAGVQRIKFIGDADLNAWILEERERLIDLYVMSGNPYFEQESVVAFTVPPVPVPANFYRMVRVDYLEGGRPFELADLDVHEAAEAEASQGAGRACGYRLRQGEIQLLPTPTSGQQYRVTYVPTPSAVPDDVTTFDVVDYTGRSLIVTRAAARAVKKQKDDPSALLVQAGELKAEIEKKGMRRTTTRLGRIADVTSGSFEDPFLSYRVRRRY
jgi:hypothetical protein